jgi:hypothetical protein
MDIGIALLLFAAVSAHAVTLSFNPSTQQVAVGSTAGVELAISGLVDNAAPSLGVFDLDVSFNPATLAFNTVAFGNQLDLFGLGSIQSTDATVPGELNLFELSLDASDDLNALQAGSFPLATLAFTGLIQGTTDLGIAINALGDALGNPISADVSSGSITVGRGITVPEPSSLLLLAAGLLAFLSRRMREGLLVPGLCSNVMP